MEERFKIARQFGNASFLVYELVKSKGEITKQQIIEATGLSDRGIRQVIKILTEVKIIQAIPNKKLGKEYLYRAKEPQDWRTR